ncbi:MAG: hydrogenase maturation protease [Leptolyngbya sp. SIO1D8]|nr:hydrogenase maturation protease [Leptolyngbya sp. SIO1D8]
MLTIIGCGNLNRSDDGVGVLLAQKLQHYLSENPLPDVRIFDTGTAGIDVMFQARGSRELIIIDASQTGSEPGAVYEVPGEVLEQLPNPSYNLHDFRWDHAIAAGRKIFKDSFPTQVTVYLIEAQNLDFGWTLSPAVEAAAAKVLQMIIQSVENRMVLGKDVEQVLAHETNASRQNAGIH